MILRTASFLVLEGNTQDPMGSYTCRGLLEAQTGALDQSPLVRDSDGALFLTWTPDYCLGMLSNTDGNYLNAASWTAATAGGNATVEVIPGAGADTVHTRIPTGGESRLFARLRVSPTTASDTPPP